MSQTLKQMLQVYFLVQSSHTFHPGIRVFILQVGNLRPGEQRNLPPVLQLFSQDSNPNQDRKRRRKLERGLTNWSRNSGPVLSLRETAVGPPSGVKLYVAK